MGWPTVFLLASVQSSYRWQLNKHLLWFNKDRMPLPITAFSDFFSQPKRDFVLKCRAGLTSTGKYDRQSCLLICCKINYLQMCAGKPVLNAYC